MMKKLHSWTGLVATSAVLALAPGYLLADNGARPAAQSAGPTAAPAEGVPPGVRAQRPNAAAKAAAVREEAATQKTRARRKPKVQNRYKEARGQEPQLVDVPDPVDINSD